MSTAHLPVVPADALADVWADTAEPGGPWQTLLRTLVETELRYYGFTEEEIALTRLESPHTDECEYEYNTYRWLCEDEDGKSYHPEWDEADRIAGIIVRALEQLPRDRFAEREAASQEQS